MMSKQGNTSGASADKNPFAEGDSKAFGTSLAGKLQQWMGSNSCSLHYLNVSLAYQHLYGMDVEGVGANAAAVTRSGEQGSIAELRIPNASALLMKTWNLVVGPEFSWVTTATTTDFASEAKALTARNALQYYWADKNAGANAKSAAQEAIAFGEAAMHIPWDAEAGEDVGVDENDRIIKTGDIRYQVIPTWDIIRDPTAKSFASLKWIIVREWHNKFDMAESCNTEEAAKACLQSTDTSTTLNQWVPFGVQTSIPSDLIPVYYLYHQRTASVPAGRQSVFLENGVMISDEPLDEAYWNKLPVVRMAAGEYRGTPFPYSKFFGTLGAQQASDSLYRDLLTNATATSGCLISDVLDSDVPFPEFGGGPKVIYRKDKNTPPPQPINLQQSHPEHFNLVNRLRNEVQQIMGIDNITANQDVGANLSGAAMALLTSTSVQNNSQLQAAWRDFVQDIGTVTLSHIQHHMPVPRKIVLAGNARASLVQATELSGDAVMGIERVLVVMGSALSQTDAGKYEIATTALKNGWVKIPEQFQTVLDTGRLDALTQDLSNELMLINSENEALSNGDMDVPVTVGDDHALHLKSHKSVTSSLTARRNPKVLAAYQKHQDEHIRALRETDPVVLQYLGQQPAQPPQAANNNMESMPANDNSEGPALDAQGPSLPKNPMTGEQADPVAGAIPPALAIRKKVA